MVLIFIGVNCFDLCCATLILTLFCATLLRSKCRGRVTGLVFVIVFCVHTLVSLCLFSVRVFIPGHLREYLFTSDTYWQWVQDRMIFILTITIVHNDNDDSSSNNANNNNDSNNKKRYY